MTDQILTQDEVDALLQGIAGEGDAVDADAAAAAKAKPRRRGETRNPIQHVHFSSFIIQ